MLLITPDFDLGRVEQELIVSATIFSAIIGAFSGGIFNDILGRRAVILISSIIFMAGSGILAVAKSTSILILGRFVIGLGVGLASMTVPVYIAEAAPSEYRGMLVTINNLFITGGQFIASVIDGVFSNTTEGWRW